MSHNSFITEISEYFYNIVTTMETWRLAQKTSIEFAHVDAHTLQDIGVSNSVRFIEVNMPFGEK